MNPEALDNPIIVLMIFFSILLVAWAVGEARRRWFS